MTVGVRPTPQQYRLEAPTRPSRHIEFRPRQGFLADLHVCNHLMIGQNTLYQQFKFAA